MSRRAAGTPETPGETAGETPGDDARLPGPFSCRCGALAWIEIAAEDDAVVVRLRCSCGAPSPPESAAQG